MLSKRRFWRFLMAGGSAAGVNVVSRWALDMIFSYEVAVALAYLCGMTTAFLLTRTFVFRATGRASQQYMRFAVVNAASFAQVWLTSVFLARIFFPSIAFAWHPDTVAHVIGVISPVVTSYLGHKHFTFRQA